MSRTGDYRGGGYRSNVYRDRARERAPRQSGSAKGPKALLFVQSGSAPQPTVSPTTAVQREALLRGGPGGKGSAIGTLVHVNWWLVECENAEAGRTTIRAKQSYDAAASGTFPDHYVGPGRILAHGSRAPREAATTNEGGGSDAE